MNIGHWTLHIAHCAATTTGRAGPWSTESMTPCGHCSFVLFSCPRLTRPSLADPRFRRASERHPRTIFRRLQIESNPQSAPPSPPPPSNCRITAASRAHGRPVRPHQGYHHQGCPLTDRGRVTGVTTSRVPVDRCACFQDKIGLVAGWPGLAPSPSTLNLHLQPPGAVEPVMHFTTLQPLSISGRLPSSHRRHQGRHTHPLSVIAGEASHAHAPCAPGFRLQRNESKRPSLRVACSSRFAPSTTLAARSPVEQRPPSKDDPAPNNMAHTKLSTESFRVPGGNNPFTAASVPCARVRTKRSIGSL